MFLMFDSPDGATGKDAVSPLQLTRQLTVHQGIQVLSINYARRKKNTFVSVYCSISESQLDCLHLITVRR